MTCPPRTVGPSPPCLAALVAGFLGESLFGGKVLSPADVLCVSASFRDQQGPSLRAGQPAADGPGPSVPALARVQPGDAPARAGCRSGTAWRDAGRRTWPTARVRSSTRSTSIAYLGTLPEAYAWMAAARLWVAGLGMFLLARSWGLGPWGRWFAGLAFPFCGFLVVWLLYPVTSVAVWMPWLFLATDRALAGPARGRSGCWPWSSAARPARRPRPDQRPRAAGGGALRGLAGRRPGSGPRLGLVRPGSLGGGIALGVALAAVEVVPLWCLPGPEPGLGRPRAESARPPGG